MRNLGWLDRSSYCDRHVWSAVHCKRTFIELAIGGLASMYPALLEHGLLAIIDISARALARGGPASLRRVPRRIHDPSDQCFRRYRIHRRGFAEARMFLWIQLTKLNLPSLLAIKSSSACWGRRPRHPKRMTAPVGSWGGCQEGAPIMGMVGADLQGEFRPR